MKQLVTLFLVTLVSALCGRAGPVETSIVATMRLSEQPSYSWVATISDDARTYDVLGQTVRGGLTRVRMPVINSVRRQLGRSTTDTQIDLIFRGNVECVVETDDGWKRVSELPPTPPNEVQTSAAGTSILVPGLPWPAGGSGRIRIASGSGPRDAGPRSYSNLQLGISHPHEELGVIVGSHREWKVEGDVITGELTELGAQLLLVRDGQENIMPLNARGTFKIWLRDGMVAKYQVTLAGTLRVTVASGRKEIQVNQLSETVLKDIGTTTFEVPAEARAKLGA